jgi:phage terminase large subunit
VSKIRPFPTYPDAVICEKIPKESTEPMGFATHTLGLSLYAWQDEVLHWYENPHQRTLGALVTPNGAGKSSGVVAALALWWASNHVRGRVVITTKDAKQLDQQLLPALERHRPKFGHWKWVTSPYTEISTGNGGRIVAFTTNDAGRAEGWHKENDDEGPLLIIVDEAKSVEDRIFQAIDRCTFNSLLYVSSPGPMLGPFYNAFTRDAALFRRRTVSLAECPHIPNARVEGIIAKYGRDHPLTKSSVFGEFMNQDAASAFVFALSDVQRAVRATPAPRSRDRSAFCDFAAGGDENVLAIRHGTQVEIAAAWRDANTHASVNRFTLEFKKAGLAPHEIFADDGGLGRPMVDSLWAAGWEINRVNFGSRPFDPIYENRGAEMWHETAASLHRGELVLPADDLLIAQLTTRKCKVTSIGKLGLESKADLLQRGGTSPDRADALCGAWACRSLLAHVGLGQEDAGGEWSGGMPGMDAG